MGSQITPGTASSGASITPTQATPPGTPPPQITANAFLTDEPLWYNNGVWGALGYAVPNIGIDPRTLNNGIGYLVNVIGRNLFAIMHSVDADLHCPPTINTLLTVKRLVERAAAIIGARAIAPNTKQMTGVHDDPAPRDFLIYPVPYFRVNNAWMQEWCGLVLAALTEAIQHTENRRTFDFSTDFGGLVGQYLSRIYARLAIEFFGDAPANVLQVDANENQILKPGYTIPQALITAYSPGSVFTSTEMIDLAPPTYTRPSAIDLAVLAAGIPATQLVNLQKFPSGALPTVLVPDNSAATAGAANAGNIGSTFGGAGQAASFPAPPGP
ncbi:MAG TPA: hypothetical protein VFW87_01900 [Pirellulales bacterium]|nr:hypothetical protein [Pirellulales bacterium]